NIEGDVSTSRQSAAATVRNSSGTVAVGTLGPMSGTEARARVVYPPLLNDASAQHGRACEARRRGTAALHLPASETTRPRWLACRPCEAAARPSRGDGRAECV